MTTYLGKSCSFGLPRVPFVNCRKFMYLVISVLVFRAGCGIWLYQFLIIAYLFTFLCNVLHAILEVIWPNHYQPMCMTEQLSAYVRTERLFVFKRHLNKWFMVMQSQQKPRGMFLHLTTPGRWFSYGSLLSQPMRLWFLSHRWTAKVQARLLGCSHIWSVEVDEGSDKKSGI